MTSSAPELTRGLTKNPSASESAVRATLALLGVSAPEDYVSFMVTSNGGEGPVGANGYVVLWNIDRLPSLNEAYHVGDFAPSLVLFGSDGGDTAFAFDRRVPGSIVAVPFVGLGDNAAVPAGKSFVEFLEQLAHSPDV